MLDIVVWKWNKPGYRSTFDHNAVNTAQRMFDRHLRLEHRLTCITDDPTGIDCSIRIIDIKTLPSYKYLSVNNPSNAKNPSCFVRLFIFSEEARDIIGEKIVSSDLDVVLTNDVTPIFDRDVEFAIWGGQSTYPGSNKLFNWYNGSLMMVKAGTRTKVWNDFDPQKSPALAHAAGCRGSDQGWIAYSLGHGEHCWGMNDGVYSFRNHIAPGNGKLPKECRFVSFHGGTDPWNENIQARYPWVKEHYK